MKIFKKIIIIMMIFLTLTTLNVCAADYAETPNSLIAEVILTPSLKTAKAGETVNVTISAKYEKGIEGVDAVLEYDKTKLEMTRLETKNYYSSHSDTDEETEKFIFSVLYGEVGAPEEAPTDVQLAIVSFKVLDTVTADEKLTIKLSEIEVIDPNVDSATAKNQEVILTVIGEEIPEEEKPEEEKPEEEKPEEEKPEEEKPEEEIPEEEKPEEEKPEEEKPGEEKTEGDKTEGENQNDTTIADKPMNDAGIKTFGLISILMVIVAFVLYRKFQKYRDVK